MKKVTGKKAEETGHYQIIKDSTGEILTVEPEFVTMSRRPGIGKNWYKSFKSDAYPSDYITVDGIKMKPPKFYDQIYEEEEPINYKRLKRKRRKNAEEHPENNTYDRLVVRQKVKEAQLKSLKRPEQ